jgi:hypothetical protein
MLLLQAVQAHCECTLDRGRTVGTCAAHRMLACDQRALNGLLFMRRLAARLVAEELDVGLNSPT